MWRHDLALLVAISLLYFTVSPWPPSFLDVWDCLLFITKQTRIFAHQLPSMSPLHRSASHSPCPVLPCPSTCCPQSRGPHSNTRHTLPQSGHVRAGAHQYKGTSLAQL